MSRTTYQRSSMASLRSEHSTIDGMTAQMSYKELQSDLVQLSMLAREMKNFEQSTCYTGQCTSGSFIEAVMARIPSWHVIRYSQPMLKAELADI